MLYKFLNKNVATNVQIKSNNDFGATFVDPLQPSSEQ